VGRSLRTGAGGVGAAGTVEGHRCQGLAGRGRHATMRSTGADRRRHRVDPTGRWVTTTARAVGGKEHARGRDATEDRGTSEDRTPTG
jgi:hypothetical protein